MTYRFKKGNTVAGSTGLTLRLMAGPDRSVQTLLKFGSIT